jgi:hypothetical protein
MHGSVYLVLAKQFYKDPVSGVFVLPNCRTLPFSSVLVSHGTGTQSKCRAAFRS